MQCNFHGSLSNRIKWEEFLIRGFRISVTTLIGMIASGMTVDSVLAEYPDLEKEDILEALSYTAEAVWERQLDSAENH